MIVASNEAKRLGKMYNIRSWSKHVQTNELKNEEKNKKAGKNKKTARWGVWRCEAFFVSDALLAKKVEKSGKTKKTREIFGRTHGRRAKKHDKTALTLAGEQFTVVEIEPGGTIVQPRIRGEIRKFQDKSAGRRSSRASIKERSRVTSKQPRSVAVGRSV